MFNILTGYNEDLIFNHDWDVLIMPFDQYGRTTASATSFMLKHYPFLKMYDTGKPIVLNINNKPRTLVPIVLDNRTNGVGLTALNHLIQVIRKLELKGKIILPCIRYDNTYPDIDNWVHALSEEFSDDDTNLNLYFSNHFQHFSDEVKQYISIEVIPIVMNYYAVLEREGINTRRPKTAVKASYDSELLSKRGNHDAYEKFYIAGVDKFANSQTAGYRQYS